MNGQDSIHLHQPNSDVVEDVVEFGAVENGVVSKVVLKPPSLGLGCDDTRSRDEPGDPCVAEVPE